MSDDEFLAAFEACTLARKLWTHEAHVRMAWLYLSRERSEEASAKICDGIRRYNASLGNHKGYHETVTRGYVALISHRIRSRSAPAETFEVFRSENADLLDRTNPPLLRHYRTETLESPRARATFVAPDLQPFPE